MRNEYDLLLELGTKLYTTGIQVEQAREKIDTLVEMGYALCSESVLEANQEFHRLGILFTNLENQFEGLRDHINENSADKVAVDGHTRGGVG